MSQVKYKRIILKVSCEALAGEKGTGINPEVIKHLAEEIKSVHDMGVEIGIVCGGGNMWRGETGANLGMERAQADYMGMLATIMNGLALQDGLEKVEKGLTTVEELLKLIDLENDETNKENIIGLKESLKLAEEHKKEEIEEDKEKETSKKSVAKEAKPQEKESVKEENKPKQEAKENLEEDEDLLDALKSLNIDFPINPDKQEETDEDELFDRTGEIEDILADIDLSDADGLSEDDLRDLLK